MVIYIGNVLNVDILKSNNIINNELKLFNKKKYCIIIIIMNIIDFIKNKFNDIIIYINELGVFKEFIIFTLIFSIIFITTWDKILPVFIEIKSGFLSNTITIIPLLILLFITTISICSHFKIFGINATFSLNHKIVNFMKYKTLINAKIETYKNKKLNLHKLYNEKYLIRNKLKYNIYHITNNINFLTNLNQKLETDCYNKNETSEEFKKKFYTKLRNKISDIAFKANLVFDSAVEIKKLYDAEEEIREGLGKSPMRADLLNHLRGIHAKHRRVVREVKVAKQRINKINEAREAKRVWLDNSEKSIRWDTKNTQVKFFKLGNFEDHSRCGNQPIGTYYPDWSHNDYNHGTSNNMFGQLALDGNVSGCGHDTVNSIIVPKYAILSIWQHKSKTGYHMRLEEGRYRVSDLTASQLNNQILSSEVTSNTNKIEEDINKLKNKPLTEFGIDLYVEGAIGKLLEEEARLIFTNPIDYDIQLKNKKFEV